MHGEQFERCTRAIVIECVLCRLQEQLDTSQEESCRLSSEIALLKSQAAQRSHDSQQEVQRLEDDCCRKQEECKELQKTVDKLSTEKASCLQQLEACTIKQQGEPGL